MSNQNNDPESAVGMAIFAGVAMISLFLFFLAALASVVLTIICIWAWNEEREVFGQTFTPVAARGFIAWGIVGAIVVGLFGQFMHANDLLLERNLSWMPHIGYVIGSLGWLGYYGENEADIESNAYVREMRRNGGTIREQASAQRAAQLAAPPPAPAQQPEQFQFASWDDEARH